MQHTSHWIQEALQKRFDSLSEKFHNKSEIRDIIHEIHQLFEGVTSATKPEIKSEILLWEEKCQYLNAMQNEWLYMKGVQDGLELLSLRFLLNEMDLINSK